MRQRVRKGIRLNAGHRTDLDGWQRLGLRRSELDGDRHCDHWIVGPGMIMPGASPHVDTSALLPADASAPSAARQLLAANGWFLAEEDRDAAVLLASELVTNAVCHGRPDITLHIRTVPGALRVEVHDQGAAFTARAAEPASPTQDSGRGLMILDALATLWGVTPIDDTEGKSVWFELRTG